MKKIPNPGSEKAVKMGCKCPVFDNRHGKGYFGQPNIFVYNCECKLHNSPVKTKKKKK